MTLPERVGKLSTPMLAIFVSSKVLVGIGIGTLLASYLVGVAWGILVVGIVLSGIAAAKILSMK